MALTDLKSDLSKFRKSFEKSTLENQSVEINRKSNLTPISDLSNRITSPTPLKETPVKSVVIPKSFDNTEKFKGETTPNKFDFSPQFTTPKLGSVDFFPNTNADGFTIRMEKSLFNFSSLSSPKPMTLEGKFLGETEPNKMSLESKFLGQTTPTPIDSTEKFKGETTPNEVDDTEKFKGQTTPTPITFTPQFTATTPSNFTFTPQFTATTPSNFTFTPQFTTPTLKIVDFIPNTDAKGFTAKMKQTRSQFVDINSRQNTFTERIKNSRLGLVNFFPNDDAKGFTKNFVDKTKSQFRGISADGKKFKSPKVTFSGDFGLSFLPGNKIKLEGSAAKYYQLGSQKWQPGGKRYEKEYVSIGDLLIRKNSPSYLTKVYSQFNLQDDSFNPSLSFFRIPSTGAFGDLASSLQGLRQPFILRGIQRKGKNEPQKWGSIDGKSPKFDSTGIDLIRGGVLTSTERALIDVARIGKFLLSPKGIAWSGMQFLMQLTNTYNKLWTPLNLLIAVGGQHLGLKPKRHGLLPFDRIDVGNYERAFPLGRGKYKDKLEDLRKSTRIFKGLGNFDSSVRLEQQLFGPESVYGIGISSTFTSTNTFSNPEKTYGNLKAQFNQKYNPIFKEKKTKKFLFFFEGKTKAIPRDTEKSFEETYGKEFGVMTNNLGGTKKTDDDLKNLGLLNKITEITSGSNSSINFLNTDNFGKSWKKSKYSSILDKEDKFISFGFEDKDKGKNTYGDEFGVMTNNLGGSIKTDDELKNLGLLDKITQITSSTDGFLVIDNFGKSRYKNDKGNVNTHFNQKYSPILDKEDKFITFGFNNTDTVTNTYGNLFDITKGNVGSVYKENTADEWKKLGLASMSYDAPKAPQSGYEQLWQSTDYTNLKTINGIPGEEVISYSKIREFADGKGEDGNPFITKTSHNDFRIKYNKDKDKIKKLKEGIHKTYFGEDGKDYYNKFNIVTRVGLGNSDTTIGIRSEVLKKSENDKSKFVDDPDLIKLIFQTNSEKGKPQRIQFRGTVNSISETFTPTWTEVKYSGRAENAYLYDTFLRELNFGFRVYAYSVGELIPMWKRLSALGKMTMPSYISGNGYYGNITKFTLGTMYKEFPALISSLQYAVPEEFTWEIGLNSGSFLNQLPMGVDVTIGLKLLNDELHKSNMEVTNVYSYNHELTKEEKEAAAASADVT